MTDPLFIDAHADANPDKPAYVMARTGESVSYRELTDRSRQAAHLMRSLGASPSSCIAIMMENHLRYLEIAWAAQRAGLRYTTISPRLTVDEVAYILEDSAARLLFVSESTVEVASEAAARVPAVSALISVGWPRDGTEDYAALISEQPHQRLPDEAEGVDFLYSSGTTGRPKAIKTELPLHPIGTPPAIVPLFERLYGFGQDTVYLS
ncbi:MAG: AMP-binding protein, partial [Solirubrobacteraceae bacterium]